jgi:two-component system response regulator
MHIEDDDDHADLLATAARETKIIGKVIRFTSADACAQYLFGILPVADKANLPLPDMILLDLELPGMNGIEFLRQLRSEPKTRAIPVVILSVTGAEDKIAAAYQAGANSYIVKPATYQDFVIKLAEMNTYWSITAEVPRAGMTGALLV